MGDVACRYKLMLESPETDPEQVETRVKQVVARISSAKFQKVEREKVAFGIIALNCIVLIPDGEGVSDQLDAALQGLEGVGSAECVEMTRV
jgi:elongation factor 1-beta